MYLYESQVWPVMITYGGIILSFIKTGTEPHPEVHVSVYMSCSQGSEHACMDGDVRETQESVVTPKDPFRGNMICLSEGGEEGER